jgi:hypothetical protein
MPDAVPSLRIRFTNRADGAVIMHCERADGTSTWQRGDSAAAHFFVVHDLTHFAVETTLGYRRAFFGLLASGWNITDFGKPWPRGPLPAEAIPAEVIVGMLDSERSSGTRMRADELNAEVARHYAAHGLGDPPVVTPEQLARIRQRMSELIAEWWTRNPGESLELIFG